MLDQVQTGRFIADMRKEKGMTQKGLADLLGISDKTVSKWETGKGMPDVSMMEPLCEILGININELLSGEKLSQESYHGKAEENMMNLFKKSEKDNKKNVWEKISTICVAFLLVFVFILATINIPPRKDLIWYVDGAALLVLAGMIGMSFFFLIISGNFRDFVKAFPMIFVRREYALCEIQKSLSAIQFAFKDILLVGVFYSLVNFISMLRGLDDISFLGSILSMLSLSLLYCLILDMILLLVENKLKDMIAGI